jgi:signal transduction histidine kinase
MQLDLRERVKELTCLFGIAKLGTRPDLSLDRILEQTVELLPPGWLYPDIAAGRITFDGASYATSGIERAVASMTSSIVIDGEKRGHIEVAYTKEAPQLDEGPFLSEERNLIDTLARELSFIIQQRAFSEERTHLREQIRRSDRLAAIGQFAAGICHELNEPLANILGFAQLASKNPAIDDQARADIGKIVAATLRAKDIVGKLSAFTGETQTVRTGVDVNELISEGFEAIETRFSTTGIRLVCVLDRNLPRLNADRSQLMQALTNLVVNAVQAMPDGGTLTITTELDAGTSMLVIRVEDTGHGIDEEIREKIFHPFFTTKDISEGAGLGLSVVHGVVTSHGGRIDLRSEIGKGSCFEIRLPVNRP